jgi:hypothetical protein
VANCCWLTIARGKEGRWKEMEKFIAKDISKLHGTGILNNTSFLTGQKSFCRVRRNIFVTQGIYGILIRVTLLFSG